MVNGLYLQHKIKITVVMNVVLLEEEIKIKEIKEIVEKVIIKG